MPWVCTREHTWAPPACLCRCAHMTAGACAGNTCMGEGRVCRREASRLPCTGPHLPTGTLSMGPGSRSCCKGGWVSVFRANSPCCVAQGSHCLTPSPTSAHEGWQHSGTPWPPPRIKGWTAQVTAGGGAVFPIRTSSLLISTNRQAACRKPGYGRGVLDARPWGGMDATAMKQSPGQVSRKTQVRAAKWTPPSFRAAAGCDWE